MMAHDNKPAAKRRCRERVSRDGKGYQVSAPLASEDASGRDVAQILMTSGERVINDFNLLYSGKSGVLCARHTAAILVLAKQVARLIEVLELRHTDNGHEVQG